MERALRRWAASTEFYIQTHCSVLYCRVSAQDDGTPGLCFFIDEEKKDDRSEQIMDDIHCLLKRDGFEGIYVKFIFHLDGVEALDKNMSPFC